jgi:hypothetical protein
VHEPAPDADVIPQRPRLLGSPERRVLEVMDGVWNVHAWLVDNGKRRCQTLNVVAPMAPAPNVEAEEEKGGA